jgi:hypothetical protein
MGDIPFAKEQEARIASWIEKVKFRRQIFGGVSQADVFKKIGELNDMYKQALIAERARYDALLEAQAGKEGESA